MTIPSANPLRRAPALVLTLLLLAMRRGRARRGRRRRPGAGGRGTLGTDQRQRPDHSRCRAAWNRLEPRSTMRMLEAEISGFRRPG